jgi:geranylgeranyl pyrophosphate synthase
MGTEDEALLREACGYLKESGSVEYAQGFARQMIADAWTDLKDGLPENTSNARQAKQQLEILSAYMVNRKL